MLQVLKLVSNELLKIIAQEPEKFVLTIQFLHAAFQVLKIIGHRHGWNPPQVVDFVEEMTHVIQKTSVFPSI